MRLLNGSACSLLALFIFLSAAPSARAQSAVRPREEREHRKKIRHFSDSTWKKDFRITDTTAALIINRIENINTTLNSFNDVIDKGYDTSDISEDLPRYQRNINIIKYNISSLSGSLNLRNLQKENDQ